MESLYQIAFNPKNQEFYIDGLNQVKYSTDIVIVCETSTLDEYQLFMEFLDTDTKYTYKTGLYVLEQFARWKTLMNRLIELGVDFSSIIKK